MTTTHVPPTTTTEESSPAWTIESARELYNVEGWGAGYFDVNERGHVVVRPDRDHPDRSLDLFDLANDLEEQGVALPVLLRFSDILRSRIESLSERFESAIKEFEYEGGYTTVYPIKVNQQRHVVEEIVQFGKRARRGSGVRIEAGAAGGALSERVDRAHDRLQRLQGRGVHAPRPDGPEARPQRVHRASSS